MYLFIYLLFFLWAGGAQIIVLAPYFPQDLNKGGQPKKAASNNFCEDPTKRERDHAAPKEK